MPFYITPFAGQTYGGRYADHRDIRAYLGWGKIVERSWAVNAPTYLAVESKRLPLGFAGSVIVPLTDGRKTMVICHKGNPSTDGWRGKSSTHRTFAQCPDCAAMVPTGRTHQHKCKA
jgi:hypothetical protein